MLQGGGLGGALSAETSQLEGSLCRLLTLVWGCPHLGVAWGGRLPVWGVSISLPDFPHAGGELCQLATHHGL